MATRLKVDKSVLLAKLRAERVNLAAKHAREIETYEAKRATFGDKVLAEAKRFVEQLKANPEKAMEKVDASYKRGVYIMLPNITKPEKPQLRTDKLDRLIRTLEAATDTVIPVSADDDFAAYL